MDNKYRGLEGGGGKMEIVPTRAAIIPTRTLPRMKRYQRFCNWKRKRSDFPMFAENALFRNLVGNWVKCWGLRVQKVDNNSSGRSGGRSLLRQIYLIRGAIIEAGRHNLPQVVRNIVNIYFWAFLIVRRLVWWFGYTHVQYRQNINL